MDFFLKSESQVELHATPNDLFDEDEDNENAISLNDIKASTIWQSPSKVSDDDNDQFSIDKDDTESRSDAERPHLLPITDTQLSFQPSSTPAHFQHRYMVNYLLNILSEKNRLHDFNGIHFFSYGIQLVLFDVTIQSMKSPLMLNFMTQ